MAAAVDFNWQFVQTGSAVDWMGTAQIVINLHVGYYDEHGNLVNNLSAIRRRYILHGRLFLDMISILPIEMIPGFMTLDPASHHLVHQFMLIHLFRIVHIKRFFKSLQSKINIKYRFLVALIVPHPR